MDLSDFIVLSHKTILDFHAVVIFEDQDRRLSGVIPKLGLCTEAAFGQANQHAVAAFPVKLNPLLVPLLLVFSHACFFVPQVQWHWKFYFVAYSRGYKYIFLVFHTWNF